MSSSSSAGQSHNRHAGRAPSDSTLTELTALLGPVRANSYQRPHKPTTWNRIFTVAIRVLFVFSATALLLLVPYHLFRVVHFPYSKGVLPYPTFPASEFSIDDLLKTLRKTPDPQKAREWSKYYTTGQHLAGKNLSQAIWTKEKWEEYGVKSEIVSYDTYVNYPVHARLAMLDATRDDKVLYEATLQEDKIEEDPTTSAPKSVPAFHGYSANGNVTAPYIFGHYCRHRDFEQLEEWKVPIEGYIVICRYGKIFRGLKVQRAQELGAVGVVMYTDPGDDDDEKWGQGPNGTGSTPYPDGPGRQPSSIQRGSVQFLSSQPGDPTTPGYPSLPGAPRQDPQQFIPKIPSVPMSYRDAIPFLKALNGHGKHDKTFEGGLTTMGVEYWTGPITSKHSKHSSETASPVVLNLENVVEYKITPIWNVIGIINGSTPESIVIGNHRDAWIVGGAGDPNSGSAALVELVRSFGVMLSRGWKPLRTIVIASWDGEEIGLLGSTEWVEDHAKYLNEYTVAYLNMDAAITGPDVHYGAHPLLHGIVNDTLKTLDDPVSNKGKKAHDKNRTTVFDKWNKQIFVLGSGSDFTSFQDHLGIPSTDFGFHGVRHGPVYHYHSNYDSFHWMEKFGDPTWEYHALAAKVLGTVTLKLSESPILPFNATNYAYRMSMYLDDLRNTHSTEIPHSANHALNTLSNTIDDFQEAAEKFDKKCEQLADELKNAGSRLKWWKWWTRLSWWYRVRSINEILMNLDRNFLYAPGLDGRDWFKHVNYAPGLWTGYSGAVFPGLDEGVQAGNWSSVERWSKIIEKCTLNAIDSLS